MYTIVHIEQVAKVNLLKSRLDKQHTLIWLNDKERQERHNKDIA